MVRTIILERRNSGEVTRYDSGWNPIEDGDCKRYAKIETGVVRAFRNIRNVRITPRPLFAVADRSSGRKCVTTPTCTCSPSPAPGGRQAGADSRPRRLHPDLAGGRVAVTVSRPRTGPAAEFDALMKALGHPSAGLDCRIKLGGTLPMQLSLPRRRAG